VLKLQSNRNFGRSGTLARNFLVNVARVLLEMQEVVRHAQHIVVVRAYQLLERIRIAPLRRMNQIDF